MLSDTFKEKLDAFAIEMGAVPIDIIFLFNASFILLLKGNNTN